MGSGSVGSAESVSVAIHASILVLLAVEVSAEDLEGLLVDILVVVMLQVVDLLHTICLFDVCGVNIYSVSVACVLLANLQYLVWITAC